MHTSEKHNQSAEDYLESLLTLGKQQQTVHRIDLAKKVGVSQAAVNKAVKLLCEKELVYEDGKHLYLTERGKAYAEQIFERHCTIREYLLANGVSAPVAEEDACRMEHLVSEETFQMMKKALKNK